MKKMTKDTVPEDFTRGLVVVDAIPVILFGMNCILIGRLLDSVPFIFGAVLALVSGALKVLWKLIVVIKRRNIWPLFLQMRIAMPIGFAVMLLGFVLVLVFRREILTGIHFGIPSLICFGIGLLGMILMGVFAAKLDSSDKKSNWIEQITNAVSQAAILIGLCVI